MLLFDCVIFLFDFVLYLKNNYVYVYILFSHTSNITKMMWLVWQIQRWVKSSIILMSTSSIKIKFDKFAVTHLWTLLVDHFLTNFFRKINQFLIDVCWANCTNLCVKTVIKMLNFAWTFAFLTPACWYNLLTLF